MVEEKHIGELVYKKGGIYKGLVGTLQKGDGKKPYKIVFDKGGSIGTYLEEVKLFHKQDNPNDYEVERCIQEEKGSL